LAQKEKWQAAGVFAGIAAGIVLLLVFGALFRGADPAFADLLDGWVRGVSMAAVMRVILGFALVAACALGASRLRPSPTEPPAKPTRKSLGLAEWVIPLAMLDALFAVFVWVQLTVLFAGDSYVLGAGGPDYAVYARGGFTQLMLVTALTLGVVAVLGLCTGRSSYLEVLLLRLLGGILCGLTLVIVASALNRMGTYADAYGFTVPRLLAYAGEVWLGLVFIIVLAAGVRLRATWLPRPVLAAAVGVLLALAAVNPDALMARTVLDRLQSPYGVDYSYLSGLSADAVDELNRAPEPQRSCLLAALANTLDQPDPWYALNLGREHARNALPGRDLAKDCAVRARP
jgi:hypothetical protein